MHRKVVEVWAYSDENIMIECTLEWIERVNKEFRIKSKNVLDVGSLDSNGSPRYLFPTSEYIGIDIKRGKGVDFVIPAQNIRKHFLKGYFDTVLCLHLFEHISDFWNVLDEVNYVLAKDGYFYVSVPTIGFPVHNVPRDFWRFTELAVRDVFMEGYNILSLEHGKSKFGKHPIINCLGRKWKT